EAVAAVERLASIDHDAGVARVVGGLGHRIERRRPATAQRLHALARVEPRAHRPYHFIRVGRIAVVIRDDAETIGIATGVTRRGDKARLFGVTGIVVLDRDGEP